MAADHVGIAGAHVAVGLGSAAYPEASICRLGLLEHVTVVSVEAHPSLGLKALPAIEDPEILLVIGHRYYWR